MGQLKTVAKLLTPPLLVQMLGPVLRRNGCLARQAIETRASRDEPVDWQLTTLDGGRAIEVPWMLRHTADGAEHVCLDIGPTNTSGTRSQASTGRYLASRHKAVFAIDRRVPQSLGAVDHFCVADGMQLPFRDGSFDLVTCVSVLEHAGLKEYGQPSDPERGDVRLFAEMCRVLKTAGRLLLTVPCGVDDIVDGWVRAYSRHRLDRLVGHAADRGVAVREVEADYFRNSRLGWLAASEDDMRDIRQFSDPDDDINGLYCGVFVRCPPGEQG